MKKHPIYILSFLFLFSCSPLKKEETKTEQNSVTENFDSFFKKFGSDKSFQKERTKFPFEVKIYDTDNSDFELSKINKEDWEFTNFAALNSNEYIIKSVAVTVNQQLMTLQSKETGVYVSYSFEKIDGLWFLIKMEDTST